MSHEASMAANACFIDFLPEIQLVSSFHSVALTIAGDRSEPSNPNALAPASVCAIDLVIGFAYRDDGNVLCADRYEGYLLSIPF